MNRIKETIRYDCVRAMGLTGRGVGVAVMDTGIFSHVDFAGRIIGFGDMVNRRADVYDDCGHGSHICGIIGGSGAALGGRYRGMAPGCNLIAVKVLDRKGNGCVADVLSGINWLLNRREKLGIRILNISVGAGGSKNPTEDRRPPAFANRMWSLWAVVSLVVEIKQTLMR